MAEKIEDLNLPNSVITRLMKEGLPDGINIGRDARIAVARATSVFILFLTSSANSAAMTYNRKTITANDIFKALYETEFDFFVSPLKEALEEYKKSLQAKKTLKAAISKTNGESSEVNVDEEGVVENEPMEAAEVEEEDVEESESNSEDNPADS